MQAIKEEDRKADFLHVPRPGGIHFGDLRRRINSGERYGKFYGISGKSLSFSVIDLPEKKGLTILDTEDPFSDCHLTALLEPANILKLSLSRKHKDRSRGKHPDLKAAPFVDFALNFFAELGLRVEKFQGVWHEGSDNYNSFMSDYTASGDKVAAAKNTWSGRAMGAHGFVDIADDDIQIFPTRFKVRALFHRPKH